MPPYKQPDFNERAELARKAKQKALDKLRAMPVPTEEELAERNAARLKREAAAAERRVARAAAAKAKKEEEKRAAEAEGAGRSF